MFLQFRGEKFFKEENIFKLISQNPQMTQREIAVELGINLAQVKYYTQKLKKQGFIERVGSSQKGVWRIIKSLDEV